MVSGRQRFYVVTVGTQPGIYTDWPTTASRVRDIPMATWQRCDTRDEANEIFARNLAEGNVMSVDINGVKNVLAPPLATMTMPPTVSAPRRINTRSLNPQKAPATNVSPTIIINTERNIHSSSNTDPHLSAQITASHPRELSRSTALDELGSDSFSFNLVENRTRSHRVPVSEDLHRSNEQADQEASPSGRKVPAQSLANSSQGKPAPPKRSQRVRPISPGPSTSSSPETSVTQIEPGSPLIHPRSAAISFPATVNQSVNRHGLLGTSSRTIQRAATEPAIGGLPDDYPISLRRTGTQPAVASLSRSSRVRNVRTSEQPMRLYTSNSPTYIDSTNERSPDQLNHGDRPSLMHLTQDADLILSTPLSAKTKGKRRANNVQRQSGNANTDVTLEYTTPIDATEYSSRPYTSLFRQTMELPPHHLREPFQRQTEQSRVATTVGLVPSGIISTPLADSYDTDTHDVGTTKVSISVPHHAAKVSVATAMTPIQKGERAIQTTPLARASTVSNLGSSPNQSRAVRRHATEPALYYHDETTIESAILEADWETVPVLPLLQLPARGEEFITAKDNPRLRPATSRSSLERTVQTSNASSVTILPSPIESGTPTVLPASTGVSYPESSLKPDASDDSAIQERSENARPMEERIQHLLTRGHLLPEGPFRMQPISYPPLPLLTSERLPTPFINDDADLEDVITPVPIRRPFISSPRRSSTSSIGSFHTALSSPSPPSSLISSPSPPLPEESQSNAPSSAQIYITPRSAARRRRAQHMLEDTDSSSTSSESDTANIPLPKLIVRPPVVTQEVHIVSPSTSTPISTELPSVHTDSPSQPNILSQHYPVDMHKPTGDPRSPLHAGLHVFGSENVISPRPSPLALGLILGDVFTPNS